jgi:hypothetical protein
MGDCMYRSTFSDLGTNWSWVISFTPRPLYLRGKSPRWPLYRRFGGPQSRSGRHGEEKILALPRLELRLLRPPARNQSLYRLSYPGSFYYLYKRTSVELARVFRLCKSRKRLEQMNNLSISQTAVYQISLCFSMSACRQAVLQQDSRSFRMSADLSACMSVIWPPLLSSSQSS